MLYGRSRIFDFAEAALDRHGPPARPFPIVPLVGPHGAGGTAVLRELRELAADHPGAALDLARAQDIGSVVFAAVHEFGQQHIRGIRRVRDFPRLGVVAAALGYAGNADSDAVFRKHIRDALGSGNLSTAIVAWTNRAAPLVAGVVQPNLTQFLANVLGSLVSGVKAKRVDGLADSLGGYDELRRLTNTWREGLDGEEGRIAQHAVDFLLVTAFISDLRADFNHGLESNQRSSNAFLLLDNCDDETAIAFLDHIAHARREAYGKKVAPDPLVVFAVQHGRFHEDAPEPIASTDPALVYVRPERGAPREDHPRIWLPVMLSPLVRPDVQTMIGASPRGRIAQDTTFVLTVAAGHPAATYLITKLMAEFGALTFRAPGILNRTVPADLELPHISRAQRAGSILDVLLRTLINVDPSEAPDRNPPLIARLAVCAATDPLDVDAASAAFRYLRWPDRAKEALDVFASGLWLDGGTSLHPLITRLLRAWLARFPTVWTEAHQAYATYYGEKAGAQQLIHTMAVVDPTNPDPLKAVVTYLERQMKKLSKTRWHDLLAEITRAPSRVPVPDDPSATVNEIAGVTDPADVRRTIARLTVAKWIHDDVLMDPDGELAQIVRQEDVSLGSHFPVLPGEGSAEPAG